jgi:allantoinase
MNNEVVFRSRRVVTPRGEVACCVVVRDGVIDSLAPYDAPAAAGMRLVDTGGAVLLPGIVDTHVHLNDPGRTEWEGFETGTRAAAAGGVTTVIDMPLNSIPPTTTLQGLQAKRAACAGRSHVDVGFWGGVVPGNDHELEPLWHAGVLGFKCFMAPSGVAEFQHVDHADLARALPILARIDAPLLVHAELPSQLVDADADADARCYANYLATRPDAAEVEAVRMLIELCRAYGARIHVVHVASDKVLPLLREARAAGLRITAETCPHYLHFAADDIADGDVAVKCAPPIRSASNREALWRGLAAGDLDLVASDHSPAPPELKHVSDGGFLDAWGGIASLQLSLPVVWTGAAVRGYGLDSIAEWMSAAPARLAGLERKGGIEPGRDADFVVFDPDAAWTVDASRLFHRHTMTPYDGARLTGMVRSTYLRGEQVYDAASGHGAARGRMIAGMAHGNTWNSRS